MLGKITDNLWTATSSVRLMPGAHLPTRMTVIRQNDGSIWVHSPIELDDNLAQAIRDLGPVTTLIAPNALHHLHMADAVKRFADAKVFAARGVERKQRTLKIDAFLEDVAFDFNGDLQATFLEGAEKLSEWVFVHVPSQTLIATDLVFNILEPQGILTPLVLKMAGTYQRVGCSKILKSMVKDAAAFHQSVERCLEGGITRIVMSHGEIIEDDAEARLRAALTERFA